MIDPRYVAFLPKRNRRWKELRAARVEQPTITQTAVISASTFKPDPEVVVQNEVRPVYPIVTKRSVKEVISDLVGKA
jgi:hypothetical protein